MKRELIPRRSLAKIHPRLRMILDGESSVNAARARQCGALCVVQPEDEPPGRPPSLLQAVERGSVALGEMAAIPQVKSLESLADNIVVSVFLDLKEGTSAESLKERKIAAQVRGSQAVAQMTFEQLRRLDEVDSISRVEAGAVIQAPNPLTHDDADDFDADSPENRRRIDQLEEHHRHGEGVLVGIIDVGGFDFAHEDFLDENGGTRFVRIWDQGGDGTRPAPEGFGYGAEFRGEQLTAAIRAAPGLGVPPEDIERQSQLLPGSHATHVASIAAGNRGVCSRAAIAGVLVALTAEEERRERSFFDSVRLVHAIEYLFRLAQGYRALAINISLGTNGHAHDGTDPVSRWLEAGTVTPGRAVCVAAGNAGQERPSSEGDIGFINGRIHTSGVFSAGGQVREIQIRVVGNTIEDVSENELEIWYSSRDRIAVEVIPPGTGASVQDNLVLPGEHVENVQLPGDGTFVSIYNDLYHGANGDNVIRIYLSPFFGADRIRGIRAGIWTVRLHSIEIRDGAFHGWIERDDPRPIVDVGPRQLWSFPSFFTAESNVDERSVSSLGCGHRIISVANLDARNNKINISSSQGPTRDGRRKPDVAAPGTGILAANGFNRERPWTRKTGTSMASPFVCGITGLLLAANPGLSASQVVGILRRTARPLQEGDFTWHTDSCFGSVDAPAAIREAVALQEGSS